jgi:subtilase family serine protease
MREQTVLLIVLILLGSIAVTTSRATASELALPDYEPVDWRSGLAGDIMMPKIALPKKHLDSKCVLDELASALPIGTKAYDWYLESLSRGTPTGNQPWMTLRAVSEYAEVWTQDYLWFLPGDPRNSDPYNLNITQEMCQYLADQFSNLIYATVKNNFGIPFDGDGSNTLFEQEGFPSFYYNWTATDNPQRVIIGVLNIRDQNYQDPYYPAYTPGIYDPGCWIYNRNMIRIDAYRWWQRLGPTGTQWFEDRPDLVVNRAFVYEDTLAHELQHGVHGDRNPGDDVYMSEGCSLYASYLCGYGIRAVYINSYLYTPDNSLILENDQGDMNSVADYGAAVLWTIYLSDHYGGSNFTSHFVQAGVAGKEGIESTLSFLGYSTTFNTVYHDWKIANLVRSDSPGDGRYNYHTINLNDPAFLPVSTHNVQGLPVPWTRGTDFGNTTTLFGQDTQVSELGPFGSDYIKMSGWSQIGKIDFVGNETNSISGWTMTADGWWSGTGVDLQDISLVGNATVSLSNPTLTIATKYDFESIWDFGFVQISTDSGATWTSLSNEYTTYNHESTLPAIIAQLPGMTDYNPDWPTWTQMSFDLTAYSGQTVMIGFRYMTDWSTTYEGWWINSAALSGEELTLTPVRAAAEFQVTLVNGKVAGNSTCYEILDVSLNSTTKQGEIYAYLEDPDYAIMIVSSTASKGLADYLFRVETEGDRDLCISSPDIVFSETNPSEGQSVRISATVLNDGTLNVENVAVQFLDCSQMIGEELISSISHHSEGTVSVDWTAEGEGFHLIKVVIDPRNEIVERDEENNDATRSLLVGDSLASGGITLSGTVNPSNVQVGSSIAVTGVALYNTTFSTGQPVAGANVTITILGWMLESTHTVKSGNYDERITAPYFPGNYSVIVTVTDNTLSESIEIGLIATSEAGTDLTLSHHDISFSPTDPAENESVLVTATIHNVGTEDAINVPVTFYVDSAPIHNSTLDNVPAGSSSNLMMSWDPLSWGWHQVKVVIDPEAETGEFNKNNNEASASIYVYSRLADLTPTGIEFSDNTPLLDQEIVIAAKIRNLGADNASNVLVSFFDCDGAIGNSTIPWISGKGGSETASITCHFGDVGCHEINVTVDFENNIAEADETNNWLCKNISVHAPSIDLTISPTDISFSNSTPTVGDTVTIYAAIHNIGEVNAENVSVEFFDADTRIGEPTIIPSITADEVGNAYAIWKATPVGWHQIKVIVDGNNTITELVENNNEARKQVYVYPQTAGDPCIYSENIVFSNTCPIENENVTIYATIHNIGDAEAQNVSVALYVDDIQLGPAKTISSIEVGGESTVTSYWIASQIGSHVAKVKIDTLIEKDKGNNVATRALIVGKHDITLTQVLPLKSIVCQSQRIRTNVTIENRGLFSETFNITFYADATLVQTLTVHNLPGGNSTIITFAWNTTGFAYGNYTLSAYAWPVPGETNIADNNFTGGWIIVALVGDITGPSGWPDGDVDIRDVSAVARLFGVSSPSPGYNPNFDINDDGDIDIKDVSTVARHYGEHL